MVDGVPQATHVRGSRWTAALVGRLRIALSGAHKLTYSGLMVVALGFSLLLVAWGRVAGLADVSLQVPYVLSAGFTGIATVICGLVMTCTGVRRQEAGLRLEQLDELRAQMAQLRALFEEDGR